MTLDNKTEGIKVISFYKDEENLKKLEPFINQKKIVLDNGFLFVKDENLQDIINILSKHEDYYDGIESLEQHIYWLDNEDYIQICNKILYKSKCIDKLIDKMNRDESIADKIFEQEEGKVFDYLIKQIDLQFVDVLADEINEMREVQKNIKNGNKVEWR